MIQVSIIPPNNYWRKKMAEKESSKLELAPFSFPQPTDSVFTCTVSSGATLLFPNGFRYHFGSGTKSVFLELLNKSLATHVLPELHDALLSSPGKNRHA